MKVRFTATALAELHEIRAYIAKDNPAAARAVIDRIEQVIARIRQFPHIARPIEPSGVRVFPAGPYAYLIFYSLEHDEIIIRNVRHAKRNWPDQDDG